MLLTKKAFNTLGLIYLAFMIGPLFFLTTILLLKIEGFGIESFRTIGPLISVMTIAISFFIYNKRKAQIKDLTSLDEKFTHFRTSTILRTALLEGGNSALVVFILLDHSDWVYLIFFVIGIGVLLLIRPTPTTFIEEYKLNPEETAIVKKMTAA